MSEKTGPPAGSITCLRLPGSPLAQTPDDADRLATRPEGHAHLLAGRKRQSGGNAVTIGRIEGERDDHVGDPARRADWRRGQLHPRGWVPACPQRSSAIPAIACAKSRASKGSRSSHPLADADIMHRQGELVGQRHEDAAARGSIKLRHDKAGHAGGLAEDLDLRERVLAHRCIEHEQNGMRGAFVQLCA